MEITALSDAKAFQIDGISKDESIEGYEVNTSYDIRHSPLRHNLLDSDSNSISSDALNDFCWISSTFSVYPKDSVKTNNLIGEFYVYPGVQAISEINATKRDRK